MADRSHPIEGQSVLLAGARASVPIQRLSPLLETVQRYLDGEREAYDRRFERIAGPDPAYYLAGTDHWANLGAEVGFDDTETDAVRRAHETQYLREGRRRDRRDEFEQALEIRQPVVVG